MIEPSKAREIASSIIRDAEQAGGRTGLSDAVHARARAKIQAAMDEARECARAEKACIANHLGSPCGSCRFEGASEERQAILEEFHKYTQRWGWNFAGEFVAWIEARNKDEGTMP